MTHHKLLAVLACSLLLASTAACDKKGGEGKDKVKATAMTSESNTGGTNTANATTAGDKGDDKGAAMKASPPSSTGDGELKPLPEDKNRPEPDPIDTAKQPPKAEDLARYTKGIEGKGKLFATVHTSMGDIQCQLYEDKVPMTIANFVGLARGLKAFVDPNDAKPKSGVRFYDDTVIHRVIPRFMIQIGDRQGTGRGTPGYRFEDEIDPSLKHDKPSMLSMANAGPNTNGSQFFITEVSTPHLDGKHAVFGECFNDELVQKIARVPTAMGSRPQQDVKLRGITFYRADKHKE